MPKKRKRRPADRHASGAFGTFYDFELGRGKDAPLTGRSRLWWWLAIALMIVGGVVLIALSR